jgi:hypothetical protein
VNVGGRSDQNDLASADSCVFERDMPEMSLLHTSQEKMPPKDAEEAPEALEWEDE